MDKKSRDIVPTFFYSPMTLEASRVGEPIYQISTPKCAYLVVSFYWIENLWKHRANAW